MPSEFTQDPLIGAVLEGRFRVISELGRGGMGAVYLAEDTRLKRRYALKTLDPQLARVREHVERFLREAQTIAQLSHPNIVNIHSLGEDASGVVFFTMEFLEGEDLEARIIERPSRPYGLKDACEWALQIARAVAAVHDEGLIHRDLKASNIFITRDRDGQEVIKLLDFGIARPEAGSELTATGATLGTPSYMSPEQIYGYGIDRRSDIYSFGVVLFKLFTGRLPFSGEGIQVAMQHCNAPVPLPSAIAPEYKLPPALDDLILGAMSKQPHERPESMREVEQALLAILDDAGPRQPKAGRLPRESASAVGERRSAAVRADTLMAAATIAAPARQLQRPPSSVTEHSRAPSAGRPPASQHAGELPAKVLLPPAPDVSRIRKPWRLRLVVVLIGLAGSLGLASLWFARGSGTGSGPAVPEAETPRVAVPEAARMPQELAPASPVPSASDDRPKVPETEPPSPASSVVEAESAKLAPVQQPVPSPKTKPSPSSSPKAEPVKPNPTAPKPGPPPQPPPPKSNPLPLPAPTSTLPPPVDPESGIQARARNCRRAHNAVDTLPVTVEYSIESDGTVANAKSSTGGALGNCLVKAVKDAQFEPKTKLSQKISL